MKNFLFFLFSSLVSAAAVFVSQKISDFELGISTVICIWTLFAWSLINKASQGTDSHS
ncbi:hypothetical protein OQZ33_17870 [Pedobacter sp. MC2016-05]|uniref:hypothetical protein n=1 Tax=Pedobacter sp. MC2016-05 TaxID=2994474 RepID=UPI0022459CFD|nr:hypothetical protein [Pedobacter sp. MC2016-05]MCX2476206.1 hypothetical protein [Pedobacter sp. MC2016-05]